jgi:hypothetical protein
MVDDCKAPLAELLLHEEIFAGRCLSHGREPRRCADADALEDLVELSRAGAELVDLGPGSRRDSIKRLDDDAELEVLRDFDYDGASVLQSLVAANDPLGGPRSSVLIAVNDGRPRS